MTAEDTLSRTARRLRPPDTSLRFILLIAGVALAGIGLAAESPVPWLIAAGGIVVGYAFRPESDRYYMEGFSDGVEAGSQLASERAEAARLEGAREGLQRMEHRPAAGGIDSDQRSAGDTDPIGRYSEPDGPRSRPARNPITEDGRPIPASGPRSPAFAPVAAHGTRSLDLRKPDGSATSKEADTGVGQSED